jgi:hypothetical protein
LELRSLIQEIAVIRRFPSLYRIGLVLAAVGLAVCLVAVAMFAQRFTVEDLATRLLRTVTWGTFGALLTMAGFAVMNVGAVRSGRGFTSVEPGRFPDEAVDPVARREIAAQEEQQVESPPRCLGCGTENRIAARFCDQCGERL